MMAEGANCGQDCSPNQICGDIVATSVELISFGWDLVGFALVKLPNSVSSEYGFLRIRDDEKRIGERIYIPQSTNVGKKIALFSDAPSDAPDGFPHLANSDKPYRIGYRADTHPQSGGSPVIAYEDNCVVGLHTKGNCPNSGISGEELISLLEENIPNNAIYNCVSKN